ncbi:MAG: hypothetical protein HZB20_06845 [Chloroflexi bacterium]|nr:hypothetical protein [Chloroflexota bacterium]
MPDGKRWTTRDRHGNDVYLTEERWEHIISPENHPELAEYEQGLKETIRAGVRQQDSLNPRKYRYGKAFTRLPMGNTHIVAVVLFAFIETESGRPQANNYVTTAYMKEIG